MLSALGFSEINAAFYLSLVLISLDTSVHCYCFLIYLCCKYLLDGSCLFTQRPSFFIEEFSVFVIIYMFDQLSLKKIHEKELFFLLHVFSLFLVLQILFDLLLSYPLI